MKTRLTNRVLHHGCRIARLADHELWMVCLRDPDDHLLALMAERPLADGGEELQAPQP